MLAIILLSIPCFGQLVRPVLFGTASGVAPITKIAGTIGSGSGNNSGAINCAGATLMTVEVADGNSPTGVTVTDANGNTWRSGTAQGQAAGGGFSQQWYAYDKSGSSLVTTAGDTSKAVSSAFPAWSFECWSGTSTSPTSPFDKENGSVAASSATSVPGSTTPTNPNSLVITIGGGYFSATNAVSGGWTLLANQPLAGGTNFDQASADQIQTATTAANPTWTFSGVQTFVSSTITVFH